MRRSITDPTKEYALRRELIDGRGHNPLTYALRRELLGRRGYYEHEHGHEHEHTLAKLVAFGGTLLAGYFAYQMFPDLKRYMRIRNM